MSEHLREYAQYIVNTDGNATVAGFDDDFEPAGPMIRRDFMPRYAVEKDGKLELTEEGKALLR